MWLFFFFLRFYITGTLFFHQLISIYGNPEACNLTEDQHIQRTFFFLMLVMDLKLRMYSIIVLKSNITFFMTHTGLVVTNSVAVMN